MDEDSEGLPAEIQGMARQFVRVLISYSDFKQAAFIAEHILDMNLHDRGPKDRFLLQGLNSGMIVAYGRPFSGNDRRSEGDVPDLPARALRTLTPDEAEIHEIAIDDRNTLIAHSDSERWDPEIAYYRYSTGQEILVPSFAAPRSLTRDATKRLGDLSLKLQEWCFEERVRLEPILKPYIHVFDVEEEMAKLQGEQLDGETEDEPSDAA